MASDATRPGALAVRLVLGAVALGAAVGARALQTEAPQIRTIFQCELNGKKVTSDRLIPECVHKEQKELNPDGSLKRIIPPTLTSEELAVKEQQEREAKAELAKRNDYVRRDRNLMQRFPDEAAHRRAREKALDELRISAKNSSLRIALLVSERKKLDDDRQFYENDKVKKTLPAALRQKLDANDAALEAQRALAQGQEEEAERINRLYDAELARLKKLWGGALPGSLGPLPGPKDAPATLTKAGSS
jgi:hypothetical protein